MCSETPPGLWNFPISKTLMIATIAIPLVASVADLKYWFLVEYQPFIKEYKQYYRLVIFQLGAINESDAALLALLWYKFRHLERLFGSRKYLSIICLCWVYTTVLLVAANVAINIIPFVEWNRFPTGALPIVLALFHFYKEYTPQLYEFDMVLTRPFGSHSKQLKWKFNNQFVLNAFITLLLINQGLPGIGCGFLSWLTGVLVDKGLFPGLASFRVPLHSRFMLPGFPRRNNDQNVSLRASNNENSMGGSDETEATDNGDEPARPLGVQFLDTFRR
ncbi:LAMI_0E15500g1_1 [Lachancea mirantina]|uniref:LAMI_0E15500g1_1 n=1 Tax=Lachancea mirantina TaxID=1230905 RepID=A0A1G4JSE0_9SACH|nr:LAMI_0E15500g1_1 [Lachancea mirantina]